MTRRGEERPPRSFLLERQPCPGIEIGTDERSRSGCARVSKKRSEKCLFDNKKRQKKSVYKVKRECVYARVLERMDE